MIFHKVSSLPQKNGTSSAMQTNILKPRISKVPEAPKKIVPEKKIPAAVPEKEKVPPTKGILGFPLFLSNACVSILNWYILQIFMTLTRNKCACV